MWLTRPRRGPILVGIMKHPHAVRTVVLCALTAVGEFALMAGVTPDLSASFPGGLLLVGFAIGPPLFLALMAWRRKGHAERVRVLFAVAVVVAVAGLGLLGYDFYRYRTDAAFRMRAGRNPMLLPLVQWLVVLAAWVPMVAAERHERK